jgi:hypothetical protein
MIWTVKMQIDLSTWPEWLLKVALGGAATILVWQAKHILSSLKSLAKEINGLSDKIDAQHLDVVKNYATKRDMEVNDGSHEKLRVELTALAKAQAEMEGRCKARHEKEGQHD